jgi:sugar phosphate isomerase/epimerase
MNRIAHVGFAVESASGGTAELEPLLRRHADLGADAAEIGASSLDLISGGRVIRERIDELVRLTGSFSFTYTVHGLVCSNFMDPETLRPQVKAALAMLEVCDRIGARVLVQHSGSLRADQIAARAGADARELDALGEVARAAERLGITVALENIFTVEAGEYRKTPAEVAAMLRTLDHPNVVGLIDVSHAAIEATFRGLDLRAELRAMAPVTGHLHIHDSFGQPAGRTAAWFRPEAAALGLGDLHLPLGWGDIAWDAVAEDLAAVLPDTIMILEIGKPYTAEHPQSLAEARRIAGLIDERAV